MLLFYHMVEKRIRTKLAIFTLDFLTELSKIWGMKSAGKKIGRPTKRIFFGIPVQKVAAVMGVDNAIIYRHLNGKRRISAEMAIRYNEKLGIPLWCMRPDLWEPPKEGGEKA